jgi:hypothetical protein
MSSPLLTSLTSLTIACCCCPQRAKLNIPGGIKRRLFKER